MKAPPYLLGAGLILWGWQTGAWLISVLLAVTLEVPHFTSWRVNFSDKVIARIADFSTLSILVLAFYQFIFGDLSPGKLTLLQNFFLQCFPLTLFPLMCAQAYSLENKIKREALFLRSRMNNKTAPNNSIRLDFFFLAACLIGSSTTNTHAPWFYLFLATLLGWSLWGFRPMGYPWGHWALLLSFAIVIGYVGQLKLNQLQSKLQYLMVGLFGDFSSHEADSYQGKTRIGEEGNIVLSNQIRFRVQPEKQQQAPKLLQEAVYNYYKQGTWFSHEAIEHPLFYTSHHPDDWVLSPSPLPPLDVKIFFNGIPNNGPLAIPTGTFHISDLSVPSLYLSRLGTVLAPDLSGMTFYHAHYSPLSSLEDGPKPDDLKIPKDLAHTLSILNQQLHLQGKTPGQALEIITHFFSNHFRYTLFLGDQKTGPRSLNDFLLYAREGHCEYFATATVFLLRQAGIPARYATGYSVQEYSPLENLYLVRGRHSHAWALAYLNEKWLPIDTTPPDWSAAPPSLFQKLSDFSSWAAFHFSRWKSEGAPFSHRRVILSILSIILLFGAIFAWKFQKIHWWKTSNNIPDSIQQQPILGGDSPFFQVIDHLDHKNTQGKNETTTRLTGQDPANEHTLNRMLHLHYRYRFDPNGLNDREKEDLLLKVQNYLRLAQQCAIPSPLKTKTTPIRKRAPGTPDEAKPFIFRNISNQLKTVFKKKT